jgi:hypothetical protein
MSTNPGPGCFCDPEPPSLRARVVAYLFLGVILAGVVGAGILATGCGDNLAAPSEPYEPVPADVRPDAPKEIQTYEDAYGVWADAWCTLALRCAPEEYADEFPGGDSECRAEVLQKNCDYSEHECPEPFPRERLNALARCEEEMTNLACGVTNVPSACYEAFQ